MIGKKEIEVCILLSYPGCTEGNTEVLTDNIYCGQDWTFKWRYPHMSCQQVIILICNYHVTNKICLDGNIHEFSPSFNEWWFRS
jgi:hypothetical protein